MDKTDILRELTRIELGAEDIADRADRLKTKIKLLPDSSFDEEAPDGEKTEK